MRGDCEEKQIPTPKSRQVNDRLRVLEKPESYLVVLDHDETDWLVEFEKSPDFAAHEWAKNMVESYNQRYDDPRMDAVKRSASPSPLI